MKYIFNFYFYKIFQYLKVKNYCLKTDSIYKEDNNVYKIVSALQSQNKSTKLIGQLLAQVIERQKDHDDRLSRVEYEEDLLSSCAGASSSSACALGSENIISSASIHQVVSINQNTLISPSGKNSPIISTNDNSNNNAAYAAPARRSSSPEKVVSVPVSPASQAMSGKTTPVQNPAVAHFAEQSSFTDVMAASSHHRTQTFMDSSSTLSHVDDESDEEVAAVLSDDNNSCPVGNSYLHVIVQGRKDSF